MPRSSPLAADPAAIARALGATFIAGPVVVAVWLLLPHPGAVDVPAVALMCVLAAVFGGVLASGALDEAPRGAFHVTTALSSLMVSAAIYFTHSPASGFAFLFLWVTPYAFLFFAPWAAHVHVVVMGLGFSTALALQVAHGDVAAGQPTHLPARVLLCVGTVIVVGTLVRRLASAVREQALASAMERGRHDDELRHRALHDALTGLPNRVLARDRLERTIRRRQRDDRCAACILVDADDFRLVNDALGHDVGDELLTLLAPRLVAAVGPAHTVARLGGDEFLVLADDLAGPHEAAELAERLLAELSRPVVLCGEEHHVTASAGVVLVDDDADDADGLLRDADAALYRAKERGRGRVELFDGALRDRVVSRMQLQQELRRGLERSELVLHYQPIVGLRDGCLESVEALVRWQHPTRGLLAPGDFIAVAEESGLIVPLGEQVLEQACRQLARWQRMAPALRMCVNVAPEQLTHGDFASFVADVVRRTGIAPGTLGLEITERTIIDGAADADGQLARLRELGVLLVLDDFGTGYSSLSYLRRFPVDILKIDRAFVAALDRDPQDEAIVRTVIDLAHTLGLSVVAEGIERAEQVSALAALGCDRAQGFHLGRPGPPHQLAPWFATHDLLDAA